MKQNERLYEDCVNSSSRKRLLLSKSPFCDVEYVDVGVLLSSELKGLNSFDDVAALVEMRLNEMMTGNIHVRDNGETYIAIKNIGILFEPLLHVNLESFVVNYSKGQTLVVCADGEVVDDVFYFHGINSRYKINLNGLTYKFI